MKRPNQAYFGITISSKNLFFSENLALLWPRFINRLFINLLRSVQGPQRSCKKDLKSEKTQSSLLFFSPGCTMHIQSIILALYLNAAHTQWPFFVWYCPKIIRAFCPLKLPLFLLLFIEGSAQDSDFCFFLKEFRIPKIAFKIFWPLVLTLLMNLSIVLKQNN